MDIGSGAVREVPLDFTVRFDKPVGRNLIHAGHLVDAVHGVPQANKDIVIEGNCIVAAVDASSFGALNILLENHPELRRDPRLAFYPQWAQNTVTEGEPLPRRWSVLRRTVGIVEGALIAAGRGTMVTPNLRGAIGSYDNTTPVGVLGSS